MDLHDSNQEITMKTINLTCDRCKATETVSDESKSKLKLAIIGIAAPADSNYCYNVEMATVKNQQEWCEKCRKEMHLIYLNDKEKKEIPEPTLEQQLAEVLRCMIQEQIPPQ